MSTNQARLFSWPTTTELNIANSSIVQNAASSRFGAMFVDGGTAVIANSTITGNSATTGPAGVRVSSGATVTLNNSILAGNVLNDGTASDAGGDSFQAASANNLIGDANTAGGLTNDTDGDPATGRNNIVGVDWKAVLENDGTVPILADNGGLTQTVALLPDSPAIDVGGLGTAVLNTSFTVAEGYQNGNLRFQQPSGIGNGQWTEQGIAQVDATAGTVTSTGGPFDRNMWDVGANGGTGGEPSSSGFDDGEGLAITFDYQFTLDADANRGLLNVGFRNEGPNAGNGFEARPQQGFGGRFRQSNDVVQFFPNFNDFTNHLEVDGTLLGINVSSSDFESDPLRFTYRAFNYGAGNWTVEYFSVENITTGLEYVYGGPESTFFFAAPNAPAVPASDAFFSQLLVAHGNTTAASGVNISASALAARFALVSTEFDQRGPGFDRVVGSAIDIGAFEVGPLDLSATAFDAATDHVLTAETDVTFTIQNSGDTAAGAFDTHIVWSPNSIQGDADDVVIAGSAVNFTGLAAQSAESRTVTVQLDKSALYAAALAAAPTGQPVGTVSLDASHLFLVIDVNNSVVESDETNNSGQAKLTDSDDITYFPWDLNGNGIVEPLDAIAAIQNIGSTTFADFDGNSIFSPLEALSVLQRIGYVRNDDVIESSLKRASTSKSSVVQKSPVVASVIASSSPSPAASPAGKTSPATKLSLGFVLEEDEADLFAVDDATIPENTQRINAEDNAALDYEFTEATEWLSLI